MKKQTILVMILGTLLIFGCTKQLNQQPYGEISQTEYYKTQADAVGAVNAVYHRLQDYTFGGGFTGFDCWPDLMSPDVESHQDFTALRQVHESTVAPDNAVVDSTWQLLYNGVFLANQAIEKIGGMPDNVFATGIKARLIAESKFLRAFYNFRITMLWNTAPLVTQTLTLNNLYVPKSPRQAFFDLVEQDLQSADSVLPATYTASDAGRATNGAAEAYLGQLYLWENQPEKAAAELKKVIDGGNYGLVDDYASLFNGSNPNSRESVLEIQFMANTGLGVGNAVSFLNAPNGEGMVNGGGWGWLRPTGDLVAEFETTPKEDPRLTISIFRKGDIYNGIVFQDLVNGSGYANKKFVEAPNMEPNFPWYSSVDECIMRYAEVLLLYAEAVNDLGDPVTAVGYINMVRARPSVAMPALPNTLSQTEVMTAIRHERRVEFCLESKVGLDLRRWEGSNLGNYMHAKGYTNFIAGKNDWLPIPQPEIDKSQGTLTQNPNW
jgi:starch-binding outer membrane protein, SusD/RagB family